MARHRDWRRNAHACAAALSWIIEISRRFFGKAQTIARGNYILNLLLFLAIVTMIFTGLMISETVVPLLGITVAKNGLWRAVRPAAAQPARRPARVAASEVAAKGWR